MQTFDIENKGNIIQYVKSRLSENGEIQVRLPKEVLNQYKNDSLYLNAFTHDGWYSTKVIGEQTASGITIIDGSVSKTENLISSNIKMLIEGKCHYIASSLIIGAGGDFSVAILFPNPDSLSHPNYEVSPLDGCFCPRDLNELGKCLSGCLNDANCQIGEKFSKMKLFLIVEM